MKKLILLKIILIVIASMVILLGCKQNINTGTSAPTQTSESKVQETKVQETTNQSAEPIKLLFWNFGVYGISYLERNKEKSEWYISKAIKRFEEKTPILQ